MKQYAVCTVDLNQIEEQINNMEDFENDPYDLIAPATQNVEYQDQGYSRLTALLQWEI